MAEDEPKEEITEEPEVGEEIDIELEGPQAPGRRGFGLGTLIVLVIIVAALAWYLFWAIGEAQQREARAREIREQGYQAQLLKIGKDLDTAIAANEQGDVTAALQGLKAATSQISGIASSAAAAGDDESSELINLKKRGADDAVEAAATIQAELQELLGQKLRELQWTLGVKPSEPAEPEEEEPAAPEEEAAAPEEAAEEPTEAESPAVVPVQPPPSPSGQPEPPP